MSVKIHQIIERAFITINKSKYINKNDTIISYRKSFIEKKMPKTLTDIKKKISYQKQY